VDLAGGGRTCHAGIRVARAASGPSGEDAAVRPPSAANTPMTARRTTKAELIAELSGLRQRVAHLEALAADFQRPGWRASPNRIPIRSDKLVVHWTDGTTTNVDVPSVNRDRGQEADAAGAVTRAAAGLRG